MKKIISTALLLSSFATAGFAQGFYFNFGLGYAFPQAGQTLDGISTPYSGNNNNATYQQTYSIKSASFSSGTTGKLGLGYMMNEHVGVQLDAWIGLNNTKYTFENDNTTFGGYQANESLSRQAKTPLLMIPSLVLQTGGETAWNIYTRIGLALPLNTKITEDDVYYLPNIPTTIDFNSQLSSSFSLGVAAAVGVQYKLNDKTTIWGEVSMLSMSLFLKQSVLKSATEDGVSISLDSISGPHKITYSKSVTVDTNYASQPTYAQPFSNMGVQVGLNIRLSSGNYSHGRRHNDDIDDTNKPYRRR